MGPLAFYSICQESCEHLPAQARFSSQDFQSNFFFFKDIMDMTVLSLALIPNHFPRY